MDGFEFASGSVIGRDHSRLNKNCQDAFAFNRTKDFVVAFVTDGCGDTKDSPYSEVGARIGARLATHSVSQMVANMVQHKSTEHLGNPKAWERTREDLLAHIRVLANAMGGSFTETISNHFLFTLVGIVITPYHTAIVNIGDGVYIINGEMVQLHPMEGNAPVYISYGLIETSLKTTQPEALKFQIQKVMPTQELDSFLIGTDGAVDLANIADKKLPGQDETVGPISQFWGTDLFFNNPQAITRRLTVIAKDQRRIDWSNQHVADFPGLLRDDTTLISGRSQQIDWENL